MRRRCTSLVSPYLSLLNPAVSTSNLLICLFNNGDTVAPKKFLNLPLGEVKPAGWLHDQVWSGATFELTLRSNTITRSCWSRRMVWRGTSMISTISMGTKNSAPQAYLILLIVSPIPIGLEVLPTTQTWKKVGHKFPLCLTIFCLLAPFLAGSYWFVSCLLPPLHPVKLMTECRTAWCPTAFSSTTLPFSLKRRVS